MGKPRLWRFVWNIILCLGHLSVIIGSIWETETPTCAFCLFLWWLMDYVNIENRSLCSRGRGPKGRFWDHFVMKRLSNLLPNVEKWTFWCLARPDSVKLRGKRFVWSVRSFWTPLLAVFFWTIGNYVWQVIKNHLGPTDRYVNSTGLELYATKIWDDYNNFRPMVIRFISNPNLMLKLFSGIGLDPT